MSEHEKLATRNVLQEYWHLLHDASFSRDTRRRDVRLLRAWGVFRYILHGSMHCEHCQTEVRLAIPMTSTRVSGEILRYDCLCTNCMFKELEIAHSIVMQVGHARAEYLQEGIRS